MIPRYIKQRPHTVGTHSFLDYLSFIHSHASRCDHQLLIDNIYCTCLTVINNVILHGRNSLTKLKGQRNLHYKDCFLMIIIKQGVAFFLKIFLSFFVCFKCFIGQLCVLNAGTGSDVAHCSSLSPSLLFCLVNLGKMIHQTCHAGWYVF